MVKILLAEDNMVDQTALAEYLKNNLTDHTLDTVKSCKEMLSTLDSGNVYDIIILDHILEDEQSLKYIDKIIAKASGAQLVVLSGQSDISVCIQYLNAGVYAYLNKENNAFKNLVKNINEIINKKVVKEAPVKFNSPLVYVIAAFVLLVIIALVLVMMN
ncbi:MAG: response regulator [Cytophagales bacterium]|nr:response regulator [Cytophagales bacterium]